MYHIVADKRAEKSAHLIGEGMLNLLDRVPVDEISISDLSRETGVSRATFYRLFDRVDDVLSYLCDKSFDEIRKAMIVQNRASFQQSVKRFIQLWMEKDILIDSLLKNNRIDILRETHLKNKDLVLMVLGQTNLSDENLLDYINYLLSYLMPMALEVWVLHGRRESPDELFKSLAKSIEAVGMVFKEE